MTTKAIFFADLRSMIHAHQADVTGVFEPLDDATLAWRPDANEWSILLCLDHLNQTHAYYAEKIAQAMVAPARATEGNDGYRASFWGRVYMFFALNPRWTFPVAAELAPSDVPTRAAVTDYLANQQVMLELLDQLAEVDLTRTPIPIARNVNFNLGDCLKVLVYHDALHMRQAHNVLALAPS